MRVLRTCRVDVSAKWDGACRQISAIPGMGQVLREALLAAPCTLAGRTFQHNPQESLRTSPPPLTNWSDQRKPSEGKETSTPVLGGIAMSGADPLGGGKTGAKPEGLENKLVCTENKEVN